MGRGVMREGFLRRRRCGIMGVWFGVLWLMVTDPTIPCGLRPSGIMGHPDDFHGMKDADRYRLLAFPIPMNSRPTF
jgi:hypothetical protein